MNALDRLLASTDPGATAVLGDMIEETGAVIVAAISNSGFLLGAQFECVRRTQVTDSNVSSVNGFKRSRSSPRRQSNKVGTHGGSVEEPWSWIFGLRGTHGL